jgi:ribonuclease E
VAVAAAAVDLAPVAIAAVLAVQAAQEVPPTAAEPIVQAALVQDPTSPMAAGSAHAPAAVLTIGLAKAPELAALAQALAPAAVQAPSANAEAAPRRIATAEPQGATAPAAPLAAIAQGADAVAVAEAAVVHLLAPIQRVAVVTETSPRKKTPSRSKAPSPPFWLALSST